MRKIFTPLLLCLIAFTVVAQNKQAAPVVEPQPYGKIDKADLEMTSCDFEKDASAEVLFDVGKMDSYSGINMTRHRRIKIFNERGVNSANVRLIFNDFANNKIEDLEAETINLENGKIVFTPVDKKQIYKQKIDKIYSALVFSFPDVKPGSVIEWKFVETFPDNWYFQDILPVRYSEIQTAFPGTISFSFIPHISQPFVKNIGNPTDALQTKALANIVSLPDEPFMRSRSDNLQRMELIVHGVNGGITFTWAKIAQRLTMFSDFGDQFDNKVAGEADIIKQAKSLPTDDDRIAFIFNYVKNAMKWNGVTHFYTDEETGLSWDKKTGNSAEINLIVYHLLKKSGINALPMVVSTPEKGKLNPFNPNMFGFDNTIVYAKTDSGAYYVLDATNKYNLYNVIPKDELNTFGFMIDKDKEIYKTTYMGNEDPVLRSVFLKADIKPEGKMAGTVEITSPSYNKIAEVDKYKTDGETKYIEYLRDGDNNLKISALKMQNMDIDSLPLLQDADFTMDLSGSDENYIYFNPNMFTSTQKNPFLSESRFSDIDLGFRDNMLLNGQYTIPAGYKVDALPKTITMIMPDSSIIFRRVVNQENGTIAIRYLINHVKSVYYKENYPDFYAFYKKMFELLNEQIVLKKSS
jgi:hypothetical protein